MPYKMSNGKWRAERMIDGKRKTRVFALKTDARKWESAQSADLWVQQTHTICWLEFCTAYLDWSKERHSAKTLREKVLAFKHSMKIIPPKTDADKVTPRHALDILRQVDKAVSGNAANKVRKNLAAAWQYGIRYYGFPQNNPFLRVERFAEDKHPRYVPPEADFWKVVDAAEDSRDKTFLLFLFYTGARVGEAFRLTWDDVDFVGHRVRLGTRKTRTGGLSYAWLPMTEELHQAMAQLRVRSRSGLVFVNRNTGEQYTVRQHFMPQLCRKAGVQAFGFHAIRHLAATILAHSGLDLPTVQAMLRHQSPTTTARYIHSLGIDRVKIEEAYAKREGAKVVPFTPSKQIA
ncbi:MAG: tyrosine-type recombinase/integrase [Desulfovibrio sp.]|nr:tyrosine-type recombinase/integrase [Desulfovibrio sp.]